MEAASALQGANRDDGRHGRGTTSSDMKVLVTGADGFVGQHLGRALRAAGHDVLEHSGPDSPGGVDITDGDGVRAMLETRAPDAVIHLAAVSSVSESHRSAARTFSVNVLGTVNLLTAARAVCPKARVLVVGSVRSTARRSMRPLRRRIRCWPRSVRMLPPRRPRKSRPSNFTEPTVRTSCVFVLSAISARGNRRRSSSRRSPSRLQQSYRVKRSR